MENKCKKAKWLTEEASQIAVKRREGKCKGEKENYKHLNAEFQRIAIPQRSVQRTFPIQENGKDYRSLQKIRDTKGTFHAKMDSIKDRNGRDLTEAEDINKRGKNAQKNYTKKDLHDPDNHDGVITDLEPDILE